MPQSVVESLATRRDIGSIPHIFSHINMTYHILHVVLTDPSAPAPPTDGWWLDELGVENANVGTGVKKVWAEIYGSWGSFDATTRKAQKSAKKGKEVVRGDGKVSKKVMMPAMPSRKIVLADNVS